MKKLIFLLLLVCSFFISSAISSDENGHASLPMLNIYIDGIQQFYGASVSANYMADGKVKIVDIDSKAIKSFLSKEFNTDLFEKSVKVTGKLVSIKYGDGSFTEFGAYELDFSNVEDFESATIFLKNIKRNHFRTKKIATRFSWHQAGSNILMSFGRYNEWKKIQGIIGSKQSGTDPN